MKSHMTPAAADAYLANFQDVDFDALTVAPEDTIPDAMVERLVNAAHSKAGRPSLTAPGEHSPQITLRLPEVVNNRLIALAKARGQRRSTIVREALDQYLAATSA